MLRKVSQYVYITRSAAASTVVVPHVNLLFLDTGIQRWGELDKEAQWKQGSGGPCKGGVIL